MAGEQSAELAIKLEAVPYTTIYKTLTADNPLQRIVDSNKAADKYDAFPLLRLPGRKWPNRAITKPPRWLSTDLRDGNQSLPEPMRGEAKLEYLQFLLSLGYKEIEISYPSASQTEFDFTRLVASTPNLVPEDVWIQVMAPCREELIRTTVASVRGAKKVIVHLHLSTAECFRRIVFNKTEAEMIELAVQCSKLLRQITKESDDPELRGIEWIYEFTPENFQDTSVDFAVEICGAIKAAWEPTEQHKIIFNLPSTIETAMPNVFADQIELFCSSITERNKVCVSVHNHNDRGCAVATAEMSQLAGADRVEGCLFGNGERTGNVDLVTLALNLYTQGIDPGIGFGNIDHVVEVVERLTKLSVHSRAPYAGKYVFCTFTGVHQDAIRKGYKRRRLAQKEYPGEELKWEMPYLPMDPEDLGRKHESAIRVNSQSGKSGTAWLVREAFNIELPTELELAFTRLVQHHATRTGHEITAAMIKDLFTAKYILEDATESQLLDGSRDSAYSNGTDDTLRNGHVPLNNGSNGLRINGNGTNKHFSNANGCVNGHYTNGELQEKVHTNGHQSSTAFEGAVANRSIENGTTHLHDSTTDNDVSVQEKPESQNNSDSEQRLNNGLATDSAKANASWDDCENIIQESGSDLFKIITKTVTLLGLDLQCVDHKADVVDASESDSSGHIVSFVKLGSDKTSSGFWGVGIHKDPAWASLKATLKAGSNARLGERAVVSHV